ncbi:hypothetical protein [Pseudomonas sp. NPDC089401]|uniref:hypothetical protein n=1 Tax=Pseudomonas sp. NPDC089401 TaxID=3364462 RepID=UPI00382B1865
MSSVHVNAIVYIWYPEDEKMGHAALYIGDPLSRMALDLPFDAFHSKQARQMHREYIERHNTNYVSWWPEKAAGAFNRIRQGRNFFLEEDIESEQADPHVVYKIRGLDELAMNRAWESIRSKPGAHYQFLRKNCATVVMRILRAGGALQRLPPIQRGWFSHSLYVTPKNIAQVGNGLRDAGWAQKVKDRYCPSKQGFNFGLR